MAGERILDGLNDAQREAVTHDAGPVLIVAGAGTGKTTVITRRIAHLIARKRARPGEILALTFTDKAAAEMEERVDTLVPYGYADVEIATFHAFGDRILREHALELGLQPDFRVLNRAEQVIFFRDRLFQFPLERYRPLGDPTRHLQALITLISRCKDEDISPEDYRACAERLRAQAAGAPDDAQLQDVAAQQAELAAVYAKYQELMGAAGAVDFGDQIALVLKLLRARPHVLNAYQRRFRYILVDEFQDTNWSQFEIVKLLGARHGNVAVCGDDNQAIYRWRGAALSNFRNYLGRFPQARVVVLTENYRSHHRILDAAYRLILNNPERLEESEEGRKYGIVKKLTAVREPDGPDVRHLHYETASQEADAVAQLIRERVEAGAWTHDDVAVLVRSNNDADQFLRSFNLRGIPWTFSGNAGLYGRPEIRLLIAFLRSVAHPDDSVSVHYLASSDLYQVPIVDLTRCTTYADRRHRWLFDVLRGVETHPELGADTSEEGRAAIRRLVADLTRYMELAREMPTGEVLYQFLVDSGWLARMSKAATARDEAEVQNISKFFRRVQDASRALRYDNVREFVNHLDALIDAGEDPAVTEAAVETPAVRVLTVHRAKGLEFPVVFLVTLVQDKFPLRGRKEALEIPAELVKDQPPAGDYHKQEERRLFYVGMTRARRELFLTSARDYGGARERKVSQFVLEALGLETPAPPAKAPSARERLSRAKPPAPSPAKPIRMRLPEPLRLDAHGLDDYVTCPLKFRYSHVLRLPIMRHHLVIYGAALHKAVEQLFRRRLQGQEMSEAELLQVFEHAWSSEGFLTREHETLRLAQGRDALKRFYLEQQQRPEQPTLIEEKFSIPLDDLVLVGRWDRVDRRGEEAVIIDYKSSVVTEQAEADQRVKRSLQMQVYALAWTLIHGRPPSRLELRFLETGLTGQATFTDEDLEKTKERIREVARGIRTLEFPPQPSEHSCRWCAYQTICPYALT